MPKTTSVDLKGVPDAGAVRFLRAEWQVPRTRFVILRFSVDNKELPVGLRMDLDKVAILDDYLGDDETNRAIKERAQKIWDIVIKWRKEHHETYV